MRFSLKYRIAIIIFVLEAIMMAAVLWFTLEHTETATRAQFAENEQAILEVMSGISHIALLTGEYSEIQPYFENLLEDSRIEQVMLVDSRGIVVAGTREESIGKLATTIAGAPTLIEAAKGERFWRSSEIRNEGGLLGVLAIELTHGSLSKMISEARNLGLAIAIVGMAIIAIVGLLAGFVLTRRLARVTTAASEFSGGNLRARSDLHGRDEIGDLGQTFDAMADRLQAAGNEAENLIRQLSDKNAELERFAYTVSHDLKSPLVTVKGYIGMLQKDIDEDNRERVVEDLEFINTATDTMALLLEDLLELSRSGQVVNESETLSLSEIFREAASRLEIQVSGSRASVDIQPEMPVVQVDRQRMIEVAQNLLENALKFSQPGGRPRISVNAKIDRNEVCCQVSDAGIGIEAQYQEQIFGLFNRLDPSCEGTGIGLALVKRIVEVHGGSVSVESEGADRGSCFSLRLPRADLAKPEAN